MSDVDPLGFIVKQLFLNDEIVDVTMRDVVSKCHNKNFYVYKCLDCGELHFDRIACKSMFCEYCNSQKLSVERKKFQKLLSENKDEDFRFITLNIKNIHLKDFTKENIRKYNNITGELFHRLRKINLKKGKRIIRDKQGNPVKKYSNLKYLIINEAVYNKETMSVNLHSHVLVNKFINLGDGGKTWDKLVGYNSTFKIEKVRSAEATYNYICKYLTKPVSIPEGVDPLIMQKVYEKFYYAFKGIKRYRLGGFKTEKEKKGKLICNYCLSDNVEVINEKNAENIFEGYISQFTVTEQLKIGEFKQKKPKAYIGSVFQILLNNYGSQLFDFERKETLDFYERKRLKKLQHLEIAYYSKNENELLGGITT